MARSSLRIVVWGLFVSLLSVLAVSAADIKVSGLTFSPPAEFRAEKPASAMRKAQFKVGADATEGEIVVFYFGPGGAGGVDANVQRWFRQFKEPKEQIDAKTEKAKAGEAPVTFVTATGTFLSGPPRGPKVEKADHALLGAIVEGKDGAVFIKFTGPKETVAAHTDAFKKMITEAK